MEFYMNSAARACKIDLMSLCGLQALDVSRSSWKLMSFGGITRRANDGAK
jgi:hypothetical protein